MSPDVPSRSTGTALITFNYNILPLYWSTSTNLEEYDEHR